MRIEACLAVSVLIISGASAKVPVSFGTGVLNYKNNFSDSRISDHRSGLASQASALLFDDSEPITRFSSGLDNPEEPKSAGQVWRSSFIPEFEVAHSGEDEIKGMLEAKLKSAGLSEYSYASEEDLFLFATPPDSSDFAPPVASGLSETALIKQAEKSAKKYLSGFKGRIEFENSEIGYMDNRIHNVRLRFRRIFNNGIVLKDLSYVYVKVDRLGKLKEIRVKWPLFKKIEGWETSRGISKAMALAESEYANLPDAIREFRTMHPKNAAIQGMAAAWFPVEEDGTVRITPCYSFSAEVEFDSGFIDKTFIHIPLLEKYATQSGEIK